MAELHDGQVLHGTEFWILDAIGEPERVEHWVDWAQWWQENKHARRLKYQEVGRFCISTQFTGVASPGSPLLWETLVCEDVDGWRRTLRRWLRMDPVGHYSIHRSATRADAYRMHFAMVAEAKRRRWWL